MFHKIDEMCDVVSLLIRDTDNPAFLMSGTNTPSLRRNSSLTAVGQSAQSGLKRASEHLIRLPSIKVEQDDWTQTAADFVSTVLGRPLPVTMLKQYKIWAPGHTQSYLFHVVYLVDISRRDFKPRSSEMANYRWMSMDELDEVKFSTSHVGPEIWTLLMMVSNGTGSLHRVTQMDILTNNRELITEVTEPKVMPSAKNSNDNLLELLRSADLNRNDQVLLYREFLITCFPYIYLHPYVFAMNIMQLLPEWSVQECLDLFRAADFTDRGTLAYNEYLHLFAICDMNTPHVARSAELRCRFIFRFFDRNEDGYLSVQDFRQLLIHVHRSKKLPMDEEEIKKTLDLYSITMGLDANHPLTLNQYLQAAGDLRLRGTGSLLRFTKNFREYICHRGVGADPLKRSSAPSNRQSITYSLRPYDSINIGPLEDKSYTLAVHTVRVSSDGNSLLVDQLWNRSDFLSPSSIRFVRSINSKLSNESFLSRSPANEIIAALKQFQHPSDVGSEEGGGSAKRASFSWDQTHMKSFGIHLIELCNGLRTIMQNERRMLAIRSPVYVLGDLHGNYRDLMHFERLLWPTTPTLVTCNMLFLGDYVDRGPNGVEVVAYLFAYKFLNPYRVSLVRGNHEIRDIQKSFTFYRECVQKFGEELGVDVWTAINNVFDVMPLAAVIDMRIFCCHGGIPPPSVCSDLQMIDRIPVPLALPDQQSELAWNLMWNDPLHLIDVSDEARLELSVRSGFMVNTNRGTGYIFNADALNKFLTTNNFTHMIRAHEAAANGAVILFDGKLLTVFSTSHYCGTHNDAAAILVDSSKIRVIRTSSWSSSADHGKPAQCPTP